MRPGIKRTFFTVCWLLGLFHLARALTRNSPRIICYRGFALVDEARFRPDLFISKETFKVRLKLLARHGFSVVSLAEAIDGIEPPRNAVALTADDAFYGAHTMAAPILAAQNTPVTITANGDETHDAPVFHLTIQYLFWKTERLHLQGLSIPALRGEAFNLRNQASREQLIQRLIAYGESLARDAEREAVCDEVAERLGLDYQEIKRSRILTPIASSELHQLTAIDGVDVCWQPPSGHIDKPKQVHERPRQSRKSKRTVRPATPTHPVDLESQGATSNATSTPGCSPARPKLMPFFDSESVSAMEFRAEIFGFSALLHQLHDALFGDTPLWSRNRTIRNGIPQLFSSPRQRSAKVMAQVPSQDVSTPHEHGNAVLP